MKLMWNDFLRSDLIDNLKQNHWKSQMNLEGRNIDNIDDIYKYFSVDCMSVLSLILIISFRLEFS
jgi:hypothetical protein